MKKIKYIIMAMTGVFFASCMGSEPMSSPSTR